MSDLELVKQVKENAGYLCLYAVRNDIDRTCALIVAADGDDAFTISKECFQSLDRKKISVNSVQRNCTLSKGIHLVFGFSMMQKNIKVLRTDAGRARRRRIKKAAKLRTATDPVD